MVNHYLKEVNQNRLCVYYDGMGQKCVVGKPVNPKCGLRVECGK